MRLNMEALEDRRLLASDWQNAILPYDVDNSGIVQARDVLLVVQDLNTKGSRHLPPRAAGSSEPLCDVNGDNRMSPQDALLLVAGLNRYTQNRLFIDVDLDAQSDPNGNEVVLQAYVTYRGTTLPYTKVRLESLDASDGMVSQIVVSNADGKFHFSLDLPKPINHLRFTAYDPRARTQFTERLVRMGNVIADWNAEMLEAVRESTAPSSEVPGLLIKPPPPLVAKHLAMLHVAMFDAINAITPQYASYALNASPQTDASEIAAAASAAHRIASVLYNLPFHRAKWDLTLAESLAQVPDGPAKTNGIAVGRQAADAILAMRDNDGSSGAGNYVSQNIPGKWQPTPPDFAQPTLPQWPNVTPFVMEWGGDFRPPPPPDLNSDEYTAAVDQVMRLGSANSEERTVDQSAIALFWADGGGTVTPPGRWNSIAMDMALTHHASLLQSARSMALVNLALVDAGISAWDAKFAYDLWRPIDAIRKAGADNNAATIADLDWSPLISTPSFPSYTSGHSTFSAAAAAVLTSLYGSNVNFAVRADKGSSGAWPPADDVSQLAVRTFTGFHAAALEAGMSRIYGGIHFSFDNAAGLRSGKAIGELVIAEALKPISRT
jgi:membrane-associated phospholipid phosphatase